MNRKAQVRKLIKHKHNFGSFLAHNLVYMKLEVSLCCSSVIKH